MTIWHHFGGCRAASFLAEALWTTTSTAAGGTGPVVWQGAMWHSKSLEGAHELQQRVHILFHFIKFDLTCKIVYEPTGVSLPQPGWGRVHVGCS